MGEHPLVNTIHEAGSYAELSADTASEALNIVTIDAEGPLKFGIGEPDLHFVYLASGRPGRSRSKLTSLKA